MLRHNSSKSLLHLLQMLDLLPAVGILLNVLTMTLQSSYLNFEDMKAQYWQLDNVLLYGEPSSVFQV